MADDDFVQVWRDNRSYLVDLAFRMLGNIGDAEDVVQDAFARLLRSEVGDVADYRGWLVVVVSRLCLDVLRSARVRHGAPQALGDTAAPTISAAGGLDPAERITLDDSVRMALLLVLEKLTPAQRAVFVLHDVFRYPFDEVAGIVGRPVESCRQLASRARRRVQTAGGATRFAVEPADHRAITERFIAACAGGDLAGLLDLLEPGVSGKVDVGFGAVPPPVQVGREQVARNLLRFVGTSSGVTLVSQPLNGRPGVLAFLEGRLYLLLILDVEGGRIHHIDGIRDPATLAPIGEIVDSRR